MNIGILGVYIVGVVVVFYFLMLRPQRRRRQAQQALLAAVKKGDEIVTSDGLFGTVRQVRDTFVVLEIADRKQVRLLKSAVSQVLAKAPRGRRS
jgi:preprotein translocase subunit YajC